MRRLLDADNEAAVLAAGNFFNGVARGEVEGNGAAIGLGERDADLDPHAHQRSADVIEFDPGAD